MKKLIVICSLLIIFCYTKAYCRETLLINVDDILNFSYIQLDYELISVDNQMMVPVRALSEKLGWDIKWLPDEKKIKVYDKFDHYLTFCIDSNVVERETNVEYLLTEVKLIGGITYVPLRYLCEYFGYSVYWMEGNDQKNYIWISYYDLLDEKDVLITAAYRKSNTQDEYIFYSIIDGCETERGIKIGDTYYKVIDRYGAPHSYTVNDDCVEVTYVTKAFPNTGSMQSLVFVFSDNKVNDIIIYPSN